MDQLFETLFSYARHERMKLYLQDTEEYLDSKNMQARARKDLQQLLGAEGQQRLEDYDGERQIVHDMELEAIFRAGLSIGQELSRY